MAPILCADANDPPAVQGEVYTVNQFVYVRGDHTPKSDVPKDKDFWIARVLEVRASNPQCVYALVSVTPYRPIWSAADL
jgi:hypothetical protein